MDILLMRLQAPLLSFGAPIIDRHGVIQAYPAQSMICGLLANALGYHHRDAELLQRLQERIVYASRQDRKGERVRDYQTVAMGQDFMLDERAWTTRGQLEERGGGNKTGTHIRLRDYWADAAHTVAVTLTPADEAPTIEALAEALQRPARPLFIGRKTCAPSEPIYLGRTQAESLLDALKAAPLARGVSTPARCEAWWPSSASADEAPGIFRQPVTDQRDWANQIHVGQRWVARGHLMIGHSKE
ncbi:type I-E CRISPR-associated protein Cas5/CasD [Bradymonas sediminis]|uniref:Type I-E CRISPR-associated protein Cas5/CasD n=1 Tax=Bradymonas sediminis TaxID=1548548 RepID=A0A2Z4FGY4_9DELT|nr:type I-E CRISPR-associated protein Cas5/CasD [Bradymonas sediminis]AWV88252.1 type I-E CRISPR-associated protein Cas5/CasD [Bradymonas sediminis]TDP77375.1 CRISPR-associated Cas5e family protein [Bradymonas sediminis]